MADKKIFTIEIDGIEVAYKGVIQLKDAIKELDNIKLDITGGVDKTINNIAQSVSYLRYENSLLEQSFSELTASIKTNILILEENRHNTEDAEVSIDRLKNSLKNLQERFEKLSKVQSTSINGAKIAAEIEKIEDKFKDVEKLVKIFGELAEKFNDIALNIEKASSKFSTLSQGIKEVSQGVEQLNNAINELDDIDLNITGGGDITINNMTQSVGDLTNANVSLGQSFTQLTTSINGNTQASRANQREIDEKEGSINKLKKTLKDLQEHYEQLSEAERESIDGARIAAEIAKIEKKLKSIEETVNTFGSIGETFKKLSTLTQDASEKIGSLSDILTKGSDVLKMFGVENETLNTCIEQLSKVTETLNTLQALHTSIIAKDSIVTKAAIGVKQLFTLAIRGSSVALNGFKGALISTGIGAIIVLIGVLIANFDSIKAVVMETIDRFGGLKGIFEKVKITATGIGKAFLDFLLAPIRQVQNGVQGLIKIFKAFNEEGFLGGLSKSWEIVKETASNAIDIQIKGFKTLKDTHAEVMESMTKKVEEESQKQIDATYGFANTFQSNLAKNQQDYIKSNEEKAGSDWKFTEEGLKAYAELFRIRLMLYKKDSDEYKKVVDEKAAYDQLVYDRSMGKTSNDNNKPKEPNKENDGPKKPKEPKRDYKKEQEEYEKALQSLKDATDEYQTETLEKQLEFKRKLIDAQANDEISEIQKLELEELKKNLNEKIKAREKELAEEIKGIKNKEEAQKKAAEAQIEIQQAKLAAEKKIAQAEKDMVNEVIETRRKAVESLLEVQKQESEILTNKHQKELEEEKIKFEESLKQYENSEEKKEALSKAFEEKQKALKEKQAEEENELKEKQLEEKQAYQNKAIEIETTAHLQSLDLEQQLIDARANVTAQLRDDYTERNNLGLINVKKTKENLREIIDADKQYLNELKKSKDSKIAFLNEQIKAAEGDASMQAYYTNLKATIEKDYEKESQTVSERMASNQKKEGDTLSTYYDELQTKMKEKWDKISEGMKVVGELASSVLKSQLEDIKEKQEEVTKQYDEAVKKHEESQQKLKSLEEEAKTATGGRAMVVQEQIARQMEANSELAKQEKDLAKEKEKLEKDAAKKEKQMKKIELTQSLVTSIAETAIAVVKALAIGPIKGPIMASIIGAMGAVQTGIIAKQISKLEDGGLLRGKRHSQGGMRIEGTNIEVEGNEYVVNRISTAKNMGLIDYINQNRRELKADDINNYFSRSGNNSQTAIAIPSKRMYEQGGKLTNLEAINNMSAPNNDKILEAIGNINFNPVVSVVDISSAQDTITEVRDIAGV